MPARSSLADRWTPAARSRAPRRTALLGRAFVAVVLVMTAGCGGGGSPPLSGQGDIPPTLHAAARDVSVCSLVPSKIAANILDRDLEIVGLEFGASRVATLSCMMGHEFAVPELTVELAVGPVAAKVFEDAYGDSAGGDPVFLKKVGDGAFLRSEKDARTLHIYARGSVLSLRLHTDPARPVERSALISLANLAVDRMPENPHLAPMEAPAACDKVEEESVSAAVGAAPSLVAGLAGADGSLMCSWASRPGSATVTVLRSTARIDDYRRTIDQSLYVEVKALETEPGLTVLSRSDRAGDLLMFDGSDTLAIINVIPSAGFADGTIVTTPGEQVLAHGVIALL